MLSVKRTLCLWMVGMNLYCTFTGEKFSEKDEKPPQIEVLSLKDVLQAIELYGLKFQAARFEVSAQAGDLRQTTLYPNPRLEMSREDFGSSSPEGPKVVYQLEQPIPWPRLRAKRREVEENRLEAAKIQNEIARLKFTSETIRIFYELLGAQEEVKLELENLTLVKSLVETVSARFQAGKVSEAEIAKSRILLASAQLDIKRAITKKENIRRNLATLMGQVRPSFEGVVGDLESIHPPPSLEKLEKSLSHTPELKKWQWMKLEKENQLHVLKMERKPQLSLLLGTTHFESEGQEGYELGVGWELPLFDRKQGLIARQNAELSRANALYEQTHLELHQALAAKFLITEVSFQTAVTLKKQVLPDARIALARTRASYQLGREGYMELLEAQRTWVQTRKQYISALVDYHRAHSELYRLLGKNVHATEEWHHED